VTLKWFFGDKLSSDQINQLVKTLPFVTQNIFHVFNNIRITELASVSWLLRNLERTEWRCVSQRPTMDGNKILFPWLLNDAWQVGQTHLEVIVALRQIHNATPTHRLLGDSIKVSHSLLTRGPHYQTARAYWSPPEDVSPVRNVQSSCFSSKK